MLVVEAESFEQRHDRMMSYFDHLPIYVRRHVEAGWNPKNNICAVRTRPEGNYLVKEWFPGANIVTNDGDIYYAKKGAGETPATNENFLSGRYELRTGSATPAKADTYTQVTTPVTTSRKTLTATYPKTNDTGDADNTGDAIDAVSFLATWTTTDFNATLIIGGCIHDNASPVGATKLLTHWSIATFDKTSGDTLKMFVNHVKQGV